jgi:predicted RNA-binding protein with PUA-like domain
MEIVGIAKVVKEAYQDPTTDETAWLAVDFAPHKKLKHPVTLSDIKANTNLKDMALVRLGRLSVQPVTDTEWEEVMKMSQGK